VDPDPQHCILACHLQIDADPDPAYHFDADADPDPAYHVDAKPDPIFQFDAESCVSGSGSISLLPTLEKPN
jgi:hypothetical protein